MTSRSARPEPTWRPAWLVVGGALVLLWLFVAIGWWIKLADDLDRDAIEAVGATVGFDYFGLEFTTDAVLFSVVAIVAGIILSRDRTNRFGWLLLATWSIGPPLMSQFGAATVASVGGLLPVSAAAGWALAFAVAQLLVFATLPVTLALFPTGRFTSDRWKQAFIASWVAWAALILLVMFRGGNVWSADATLLLDNPLGVSVLSWVGDELVGLFFVAYGSLCLAAFVARYRSARGEERLQLKWFLTAVVVFFISMVAGSVVPWSGSGYVMTAGGFAVFAAIGIAITKYRLYEIDIVINKALVFGGLAAFVTAVYAVVVVGIGAAFTGSSLALSITATALVAVIFEPVRSRLQKAANRLVYGARATPYEVLSDLTGRLADTESGEGLLERMAERLGEGTGAERAIVWMLDPAGMRAVAAAPASASPKGQPRPFDQLPGVAVPIEQEGEILGALSVEKDRGDTLTPTERLLLEDLAGSAGLFVRRLRLDEALEMKAIELQQSRRRLVDAQDVERRRLERDLHDGAQQQVVALKVKLGLAQQLSESEGADRATALVRQIADDAQGAIEQIRALAQGIYPPLLEAEGLAAAMPALAAFSPLDVTTEVDTAGRHPLPLEGAVYFCVSEALTNAAKHGQGPVEVKVWDTDGQVSFSVTDSGPGFDADAVARGAGLNNMADRLDALGGMVTIASREGRPTTVTGSLPDLVPVV